MLLCSPLCATQTSKEKEVAIDRQWQKESTLSNHENCVSSVAFSLGGEWMVSAGWDGRVVVYDTKDVKVPKRAHLWKKCRGKVWDVAFGKGEVLASVGEDGMVNLFDIRKGAWQVSLKGHKKATRAVVYDYGEDLFVSGGYDGVVRCWDVEKRVCATVLEGKMKDDFEVYSVATNGGRGQIASGVYGKSIDLWDVKSGDSTATLLGHDSTVYGLAFGKGGNYLYSCGYDCSWRMWDLRKNSTLFSCAGHKNTVYVIKPNLCDVDFFMTASFDKSCKMWSGKTGKCMATLKGEAVYFGGAFHPKKQVVALGTSEKKVELWKEKPI